MSELENLLSNIKEIKVKYDQVRAKERFNVFTALHKERDEVNLHSRVVSYLLSPISGHGMNSKLLEIFVRDILKISTEQFSLNGVEVIPNEFNKTEYKEIDILIINKKTKQAIIIENKIDAKDSNHTDKLEGYNGQLERYYNTIKTGKDKDGNDIFDFQCSSILVYYLTLDGHQPSEKSIGYGDLRKREGLLSCISFDNQIKSWLVKCMEEITPKDYKINDFIQQYLNLINKMINSEKERLELKDTIAKNLESTKHLIENFIHIKWHAVHEFWNELKTEVEKKFNNAELYPVDEFEKTITSITHNGKNINHGIVFKDNDGKEVYISGFNNLSWGINEPRMWKDFENEVLLDIRLADFSTENTYRLIDTDSMKVIASKIVDEIVEEQKDGYKNLKSV